MFFDRRYQRKVYHSFGAAEHEKSWYSVATYSERRKERKCQEKPSWVSRSFIFFLLSFPSFFFVLGPRGPQVRSLGENLLCGRRFFFYFPSKIRFLLTKTGRLIGKHLNLDPAVYHLTDVLVMQREFSIRWKRMIIRWNTVERKWVLWGVSAIFLRQKREQVGSLVFNKYRNEKTEKSWIVPLQSI